MRISGGGEIEGFGSEGDESGCCTERYDCVPKGAKPVHPIGKPISPSTNSGFKVVWDF